MLIRTRQHAIGLVGFDEAHASHVRREHVDGVHTPNCFTAIGELGQIQPAGLGTVCDLVPLIQRLDVDRADANALFGERPCEITPDESACPRN